MCEVKCTLWSIATNKASGGDGIPAELFQILKDNAIKVLHSTCQQIWKAQQWPQDWKRSVFIPIPKRAMPKNITKEMHMNILLITQIEDIQIEDRGLSIPTVTIIRSIQDFNTVGQI